jgi:hypothetical protein
MDLRYDEPAETELNMTPMIDIVFQLIIFFLLSLKFKTIDQRIEAMLPGKGLDPTPRFVEDEPKIKLKVFRRDLENSAQAYTLIKLDNARQFRFPRGWKGRGKEQPARVRAYDAAIASITQAIRARVAANGGNPDLFQAEIVAPPPRGGAVPHGDVIALMDAFIDVGLVNVNFEGAATPLNRRERAERAAAK